MVSLAKLLWQRIRQGIGKKYKNIGLKKFQLSISRISHRKYQKPHLHQPTNLNAIFDNSSCIRKFKIIIQALKAQLNYHEKIIEI
jgi:hypothetical protein